MMKDFDFQKHAGPVIGILAGEGNKQIQPIVGNGPFFKELQKGIIRNGGVSVVFTPYGIKEKEIDGFIYSPEDDKWFPIKCPLPDVIFNRVPFRRHEATTSFKEAYHFFQTNQIPFFNPGFLNKHELYEILSRDSILRTCLPETIVAKEEKAVRLLLEKYQKLYLKPIHGAKGKGIYKICLRKDQTILMTGITDEYAFTDFRAFWEVWNQTLVNSYIVQEAIDPALFNGKRFDFRILVHSIKDGYQVTGIGIRQSTNQDLTTHIPNGGCIIPYEELQSNEHDRFFTMVAERAGNILSKEKGFFGEFSIDAGISANGRYVIYEINSKPMRFDESKIEEKRLQTLIQLFKTIASSY